MLVELLQPTGPDFVRRLAAALMLVPRDEREAVVSAIERRVVETYGTGTVAPTTNLTHVSEPKQGPGYVEQVETVYERPPHVASTDGLARRDSLAEAKPARRRAR